MLKKLIRKLYTPLVKTFRLNKFKTLHNACGPVEQKVLSVLYNNIYQSASSFISFKEAGFRVYSQHEEDGILLFIFSLIGTSNKRCVEIACGDGRECNTANLIINHKWHGLLCDGDKKNIAKALKYFANNPDTKFWPPVVSQKWITINNVNDFITSNGFSGEIDLLSLDLDGVDYWIWKEISGISPRVVVLEFNHLWGPEKAVTVPYRDDFVAQFSEYGSDYAGASLPAFVNLAKEKGYKLVATNVFATNAFFLRNDIKCDWLQEIDPASCFDHPRAKFGMTYRLPKVKDKEWIHL